MFLRFREAYVYLLNEELDSTIYYWLVPGD
jgi:hypothetical protein